MTVFDLFRSFGLFSENIEAIKFTEGKSLIEAERTDSFKETCNPEWFRRRYSDRKITEWNVDYIEDGQIGLKVAMKEEN